MSGIFCVLLIIVVFTNIVNTKDEDWVLPNNREINKGFLKIRLIRATSSKLYIEAICEPSCKGIKFETSALRFMWSERLPTPKVDELGNNQYVLKDLYDHYDYLVDAHIKGSFDRIRGRTCPRNLGLLEDLHSHHNGPGWLDIRWKPFDSYECKQDIEYLTRHKVEGEEFSNTTLYGAYPIDDKGNLHIGPSHPCDDWPKHFCLLITENVKAGKNHIVRIQPRRIGGEPDETGPERQIVAYADPHNVQGAGDSGVHPQCQLWAWLAVGACVFCIAVIIGVLISALVTTYEKNQRLKEEALNAENEANEENEENEETEETALTAETSESRQSINTSEVTRAKENEKH